MAAGHQLSASEIADLQDNLRDDLATLEILFAAEKIGFAPAICCFADKHKIEYIKTALDHLAETYGRVAGDDVVLDEIERLIIELQRRKLISARAALSLQCRYLNEHIDNKAALSSVTVRSSWQ